MPVRSGSSRTRTGPTQGGSEVALQGGDALTAITINLVDNTAPALTVQTSGFDNMVRISTTNGSESISIGEGLITGLASAVADYAVETLTPTFILRSDHAGGNAEDPFTLPPRTGGWRLVDAYIRSTGGTAGTMTLLDATGGNAMTNAMVPGNANVVTRATSLVTAQEDVASGATPVWSGASTPPATTCYSIWVGL